ncbi:MAG TPA: VWA domain-containing protein [Polyangia bacterium]|jgi:hypothetical protein
MMGKVGWWGKGLVILSTLGCSSSGIKSPGNGGTGGNAGSGGTTGTGGAFVDDGGAADVAPFTDGETCGVQKFGLATVPPDLLIVLDKSGSMTDTPDGMMCDSGSCGPMSKWAEITAAINQVVAATEASIRWGVEFFPDDESCAVESVPAAPIADNNGAAIAAAIAATGPEGGTPTRAAVMSGSAYLTALHDPNPKYILVATDGFPNCMEGAISDLASDADGTIAAIADSAASGIPVFVVGIGTFAESTATLTAMAVAGGEPQAADPRYYQVSSTNDLVNVLGTIGGMIGSCSFVLASAPPDLGNVSVVADGINVPKDTTHTNGWDYGTGQMSVQLYGQWCDQSKAGSLKDIEAVFGCPGIVIP